MQNILPKPFVFVLMPFDDNFTDIYKLGIKPACEAAGAYCERVDDQIFTEGILERIYNQIGKADLIISDMSGRNPNVFYETGYAHALNKRVILLTQKADDIPFDLTQRQHIIYGGKIVNLLDKLERSVNYYLTQPGKTVELVEETLEYYAERQRIYDGAEIIIPAQNVRIMNEVSRADMAVNLLVHNPTERILDTLPLQLTVVVPGHLNAVDGLGRCISLPDGALRFQLKNFGAFYPEDWASDNFAVRFRSQDIKLGKRYPMIFRIYTERGVKDINFTALVDVSAFKIPE